MYNIYKFTSIEITDLDQEFIIPFMHYWQISIYTDQDFKLLEEIIIDDDVINGKHFCLR